MKVLLLACSRAGRVGNDEEVVPFSVSICIVQDALSLFLVTASAATLLNIPLQTLRHRVVDYKPYVSLIYTHTKSDRGYDDLDVITHPVGLNLLSSSVGKLSMVVIAFDLVITFQGFC